MERSVQVSVAGNRTLCNISQSIFPEQDVHLISTGLSKFERNEIFPDMNGDFMGNFVAKLE